MRVLLKGFGQDNGAQADQKISPHNILLNKVKYVNIGWNRNKSCMSGRLFGYVVIEYII